MPETSNVTLAAVFGILSIPGVLLNILVVCISVKKNLIKGEYKYFLLNLALIDLFYSSLQCTFQPYFLSFPDSDGLVCWLVGFPSCFLTFDMIFALAPTCVIVDGLSCTTVKSMENTSEKDLV